MTIRQLKKNDVEEYRQLRLEALQKAPMAFGSSYEEEKGLPLSAFVERLSADDRWTFGAFSGKKLMGIVVLCRVKGIKRRHKATLVSMFVSAAMRGQGIGAVLLDRTIAHARKLKDIRNISLSLVAGNAAARSLYLSRGFKTFGVERESLCVDGRYFDEEYMMISLYDGVSGSARAKGK